MFEKKIHNHGKTYRYFSLQALNKDAFLKKLPYSLKILLENLLRFQGKNTFFNQQLEGFYRYYDANFQTFEIDFYPARVLMQDFTGVPAIVDLAAMRDACIQQGKDPDNINPLIPVDLVIDHSVMVDSFGQKNAFQQNVALEYERNIERYKFLKWGQKSFKNFRVVPPGIGICHQVNLEYLGQTVFINEQDQTIYPDTVVGTDSHTTMINALSVLGWGVGGIEAEAAMLGQPISMLVPDVIGVRLNGKLKEGITATDLVLKVTHELRKKGVVGKFVEYYGEDLDYLSLADRATLANMAPEYGATCGFFPIDQETLKYMDLTGRTQEQIHLVEAYAKEQFLWRSKEDPLFKDMIEINLDELSASLAGPKRPQDKIDLKDVSTTSLALSNNLNEYPVDGQSYALKNHDVVIAAITSCTNTSNPSVMIAAGLLAKKAYEFGVKQKPWVKTSLAPGSQVVVDYLEKSGLLFYLEKLGFHVVGFGCTTCIGNSGPFVKEIADVIEQNDLTVAGVLSGNRNFEGRIHPLVKENYLASPPLVVAYALAGTMLCNLTEDSLAVVDNKPVYLKDIWPSQKEINDCIEEFLNKNDFVRRYQFVFDGDDVWKNLEVPLGKTYSWDDDSTYIACPPFFKKENHQDYSIKNAKILGLFGDSVTTDHISPAGVIKEKSPAGSYLKKRQVQPADFNSYGSRRGHHEVMMRGTFANIRIQNEMLHGKTGGYTLDPINGHEASIYDAAMNAQMHGVPLVVIAGKEYGTGSSRDWAAKGTRLLGVKAVIAESFERIHRSNLIGMGVMPLTFINDDRKTLHLKGDEIFSIHISDTFSPQDIFNAHILYADGSQKNIQLKCCIDTQSEMDYFKKGGILKYVLDTFD